MFLQSYNMQKQANKNLIYRQKKKSFHILFFFFFTPCSSLRFHFEIYKMEMNKGTTRPWACCIKWKSFGVNGGITKNFIIILCRQPQRTIASVQVKNLAAYSTASKVAAKNYCPKGGSKKYLILRQSSKVPFLLQTMFAQ